MTKVSDGTHQSSSNKRSSKADFVELTIKSHSLTSIKYDQR